MTNDPPLLDDNDLPLTFRAADRASLASQTKAKWLVVVQLVALAVAAVGGAIDIRVENNNINVGGFLSVAAFLVALIATLVLQASDSEEDWYSGRAGAESVKTLAWRFSVCAEPFTSDLPPGQAESTLSFNISEIVVQLRELNWGGSDTGPQITPKMLTLRSADLPTRKTAYLQDRLRQQRAWYSTKSTEAASAARRWSLLAATSTVAGIVLGLARALTLIDADLLGLLAAFGSGATAWGQFRQYNILSRSYSVANQDLASAESGLASAVHEADWAAVVRDAEEAISREHTLWLARRGRVALKG